MRILITGGSGFVGRRLRTELERAGHEVWVLTRAARAARSIEWSPASGALDTAALEGFDAVVHLAGEGIADGRWTDAKKQRILSSRVDGTRLLCGALAKLARPPSVLVSASGINIYPADGSPHDEDAVDAAARSSGFLAGVCRAWEAETGVARAAGVRVVNLRISVVLGAEGGALARMLPAFKAGAGGPIGSGEQHFSWISVDDLVGVIGEAIRNPSLVGPVNAVAPEVVTNRAMTETLARVLRRPAFMRVPAFAARALFGAMADETLLADLNVRSVRLREACYRFRHPTLEAALTSLLGRGSARAGD